jgi:predicted Rossmann fold nucleotide-binding protein DprA/Smf involved in DNA uptake
MKKLKEQLKSVSKSLASLSKQVDKITAQVDKFQPPKAAPAKKAAAKKAAAKKTAAKKTAAKKTAPAPKVGVLDSVFDAIRKASKGINVAALKAKTGLNPRQLSNALYKLSKKDTIIAKARGLYFKK